MATVKLQCGSLRGSQTNAIHCFKAIPYAEPLTGAARWLAPQPRRPWSGVRDAQEYGPATLQIVNPPPLPFPRARGRYFAAFSGTQPTAIGDDSLILNVWTPTLEPAARLPVLVWIHGGGFSSGAADATYDGTVFAQRDAVCVVIQYRLGALGFLHGSGLFADGLCADNRGFLDQICALRWVQDNIDRFGGDASRVTVFGESAGAFAIFQLAASPLAEGLFHRAIAMGGMAQTCAPAQDYHRLTADVLQDVGIRPGDSQALIDADLPRLKKMQAAISKRVLGSNQLDRYGRLSRERIGFLGAASSTEFLPQEPLTSYAQGTPNNIDLMLGNCAHDGNLFSQITPLGRAVSARLFSRSLLGLMPNRDYAAVYQHYGQHRPGVSRTQIFEQINNDAFYRVPTVRAAEAHAAGHPGRTWHYQLDYESPIAGLGAIHAIDVALLFGTDPLSQLLADDEETRALANAMRDAVVSFARDGVPRARDMPAWIAFDPRSRYSMIFDRHCHLARDVGGALNPYWNTARSAAWNAA